MTEKQKAFCREYLKDKNATQAAKRAGYSEKAAHAVACRMLKDVNVAAEVERGLERQQVRAELTADMVLQELKKIAFVNIQDVVDEKNVPREVAKLPREVAAAIGSVKHESATVGKRTIVTQEVKLLDKLSALDKLARHLGLYEQDNRQKATIHVGFADENEEDDE